METIDRKPAVAGQFYPANTERLKQELKQYFFDAVPRQCEHVRAIVCPHAGYVFSGKVAASSYNQINEQKAYKRIFILGSSHQMSFEGAAVYCDGDFLMPYGKERVDCEFGHQLIEEHPSLFTGNPGPHLKEHSLEVQLPFLHHFLRKSYKIVPILLGTVNPDTCLEIAQALKPWFNSENLFIISTDFSHYPEYGDAKKIDALTKNAILSNHPETLLNCLEQNSQKHIPQLVTSLCGWTSVLTLLYMTTDNRTMEYYAIDYSNSGDSHLHGDPDRVVGYWSMAVCEELDAEADVESAGDLEFTDAEKEYLLKLARKTLEDKINLGTTSLPDSETMTEQLKMNFGAFVSLHHEGKLRGCIGRMIGDAPLFKMLQDVSIAAALHDPRFTPLKREELPFIDLELSILSPLRKIEDIHQIELGKHGIYLVKGAKSGVFLPQVAKETGWNLEEFLGHCAQDKAGLNWEDWKTADIYSFTASIFGEK